MDNKLIVTYLILVCINLPGCGESQNDRSQLNTSSSDSGRPGETSEVVKKPEVNRWVDDFTGVGELNSPAFAPLSGAFVIPWNEARTPPAGSLYIRFRISNSGSADARIITKPIDPRLRFIIDGERFVESNYEIRELERMYRHNYVIEFRISEHLLYRVLAANDARARLDFKYKVPKAFGSSTSELPFKSEFEINGRSRKSLTALLKEAGKLDTTYGSPEHADHWHGYVESENTRRGNASTEPRSNVEKANHRTPDYDEFLIVVEALFPELNPDSVAYDEKTVKTILEQKTFYDQRSSDDIQALRRALNDHFQYDVYPKFNELINEAALQRDVNKRCVLERPMSPNDYSKCGLQAPQYIERR